MAVHPQTNHHQSDCQTGMMIRETFKGCKIHWILATEVGNGAAHLSGFTVWITSAPTIQTSVLPNTEVYLANGSSGVLHSTTVSTD